MKNQPVNSVAARVVATEYCIAAAEDLEHRQKTGRRPCVAAIAELSRASPYGSASPASKNTETGWIKRVTKIIISFVLIVGIVAFLHSLINSRINASTKEWCVQNKDMLPGICNYVMDYCDAPGQMRCKE